MKLIVLCTLYEVLLTLRKNKKEEKKWMYITEFTRRLGRRGGDRRNIQRSGYKRYHCAEESSSCRRGCYF